MDWEQQTEADERQWLAERAEELGGVAIGFSSRGYETIRNVDIFASGVWRASGSPPGGDHYSIQDLHEMVAAYRVGVIRPKLKLTHQDDGLVGVGTVENLRVRGNKLFCDLVNIPSSLYELMKKGLFKARSAEVLWNMRDSAGRTWRRVLKAVALLAPGQRPAVSAISEGYQFERAYCYIYQQEAAMKRNLIEEGILAEKRSLERWKNARRTMASASMEVDRRVRQLIKEGKASDTQEAIATIRKERPALFRAFVMGRW